MTVLYILGFIAAGIILLKIINFINNYSQRRYRYEFFNWGNYVVSTIGYFLVWYGNIWYQEELLINGDILNGQLLLMIGAILIIGVLYNHMNQTNFFFGLIVGIFQLVIYLPLAIFGVFAFVMVIAWFMDTKPVYRI